MVRVHAEVILATSTLDINKFSKSTAYEIIVESSNIGTLDLSSKTNINYLKIRGGSVRELNDFNLKLGTRGFVLVLEDITIHGTTIGTIYSTRSDLSIYFSNRAELYGKDGTMDEATGSYALSVNRVSFYQIGMQPIVIQGGNGFSYSKVGYKVEVMAV